MKIGIDAQTTVGQPTGFGFYVQNLTDTLLRIDRRNRYILFRPKSDVDLSMPARLWRDQAVIPYQALKERVDVIHHPCFSVPIVTRIPVVVTVHDLIANFFGSDIPLFSRMFFARWMPFSYRWADRIIVISENTRNDLLRHLRIPRERIRVIPLAADRTCRPVSSQATVKKAMHIHGIHGPYVLHVGTVSPRKNLEFLVRVFRTLAVRHPSLQLVMSGKRGWYYQGLFALVKKEGLASRVLFTEYVREEDKPALYSGATVFAFPSLYEGFGLPPLEAMACGTPVVASNTSSIPEVVGKAGVLLSPHNETGWVNALNRILQDDAYRARLAGQGLQQAKRFSWEETARKTIAVYEEVVHESAR